MSLRIAKFALGAPPYVLTAVLPLRGEEDATTVRPPFLDALNITLLALASLENEYIFWEGSPGHIYVEKCTRQCALLDKDTCAQITTLTRKPWQLYASSSAWSRLCVDVEGWRKSDGPGSLKALQEEADSLEVNLGSVVSFAPALPMIEAPPMSPATLPTPPPTQPTLAEPAPGIGSAPAANPVASSSTVSVRPSPATCVPAATKRRAEDVGEGTPKAKRARKKSVIRVPRLHDVKWRSAYGGVFMDEDGNGRAACIITEEPGLRQFKTTYKRGDFVIIAKPQDCTDTFAWVARITGFEYASGQAPVGRIETILASIQWFNPVGDNESREIRFSGFQDVPLLAFDALTNVAKLDSRNPTLPLLRESDRFIKKSSSTMFENSPAEICCKTSPTGNITTYCSLGLGLRHLYDPSTDDTRWCQRCEAFFHVQCLGTDLHRRDLLKCAGDNQKYLRTFVDPVVLSKQMVAQIPIARCHRPQGQGPLSLEKIILEAIATMDDMEEWEWWLWRQYPSVIEDDRVSGMAGMVRLESERKEWMAMAEDVIRNMYEADMAWYLCKSCGMQYI